MAQITWCAIAVRSSAGTFRVVTTTIAAHGAPCLPTFLHAVRPPTQVFAPGQFVRDHGVTPLNGQLTRPAAPLAEEHTALRSGQPLVDANFRIRVAKVVDMLGWTPGQKLAGRILGPRVVVTVAVEEVAGVEVPLTLDKGMRLTLSPAICFALALTPGAQVQAIADPSDNALTLLSLSEALETLLRKEAS